MRTNDNEKVRLC